MKKLRFIDKRILLVIGILILVLLMMDYNNRMSDLSRLDKQLGILDTQEAQLGQTEQILDTKIAYATSDIAVQDYARNDGKMIQPGDNPVIPLSPGNSTPQPTTVATVAVTQVENWQKWLALFLGQ